MRRLKILSVMIVVLICLSFYSRHLILSGRLAKSIDPNPVSLIHPDVPVIKMAPSPKLSTESYILIDNDTNTIILAKNSDQKIYPASTTKLATALTALNIYSLDETITIQDLYTKGQNINLLSGETLTVRSLITALLVYSANDAAYNLANHYPDGVSGFVNQMNLLVQKYNLKNTHFVNFDGIHNSEHYSTVYDLSELGRIAMKNQIIRDTVKNKSTIITDITGKIIHNLNSTDQMLGKVPEIEGLKTGWTPEAGGCFVGLINLHGHYLISVVAQSADRFADTAYLVDWAKENLSYQPYQP
jgi:D-alanyl-D-alanine carboxypeptidase